MANPYSATLRGAADDGVNTYLIVEVTNGSTTMDRFQVTVPTGQSLSTIQTLLRNIATNQPTVSATVGALLNVAQAGS
jgi:hypothetical protein